MFEYVLACEGKWIHSTYAQNGSYWEMFTYAVLVNSHFYTVGLAIYFVANKLSKKKKRM